MRSALTAVAVLATLALSLAADETEDVVYLVDVDPAAFFGKRLERLPFKVDPLDWRGEIFDVRSALQELGASQSPPAVAIYGPGSHMLYAKGTPDQLVGLFAISSAGAGAVISDYLLQNSFSLRIEETTASTPEPKEVFSMSLSNRQGFIPRLEWRDASTKKENIIEFESNLVGGTGATLDVSLAIDLHLENARLKVVTSFQEENGVDHLVLTLPVDTGNNQRVLKCFVRVHHVEKKIDVVEATKLRRKRIDEIEKILSQNKKAEQGAGGKRE